jgi:23S rRNA pseudouridine1911/1915/1917 synthase
MEPMKSQENGSKKFVVTEAEQGSRLDLFLALREADLSRSQIKKAIEEGRVAVNCACRMRPGARLKTGDVVCLIRTPPEEYHLIPEDIPLQVLYEDKSIIVLVKPAGMVVHPAAGNYRGTLVHALQHHCKDLSGIGGVLRPGIVHRLDKDTSGLMVVAKSDQAHESLTGQFKGRVVTKKYKALVYGNIRGEEGVINLPIGRHPSDRKKMSTRSRRGKEAVTRWKVAERFGALTLLDVEIDTGRTHQIRVHLNAIGYPVVGDTVYGNSRRIHAVGDSDIRARLERVTRQILHAATIGFHHPVTGEFMTFSSPLPEDMDNLCVFLRRGAKG